MDIIVIFHSMEIADTKDDSLKKMIADYMEGGFLDNIIDMFRQDKSLYTYVGDLMKDERMRVRIGTTALIETLRDEDRENLVIKAIPPILPLLKDQNPVVRGDAANLLGIIGDAITLPFLEELKHDEDSNVRTISKEAIADIKAKSQAK
jgi:hypothetical protein